MCNIFIFLHVRSPYDFVFILICLQYMCIYCTGDHLEQINSPGYPAAQINLMIPPMDGPVIFWWDSEADKSLVVGTFRYRLQRYTHTQHKHVCSCRPSLLEA